MTPAVDGRPGQKVHVLYSIVGITVVEMGKSLNMILE